MANSNPPLGRDTVDDSNLHVLHSKDPEKTEIRHDGLLSVSSITHIEPASAEESSPLPASPGNTPSPDSVDSLVGQNLDHYRIESLVGVGGMGAVFRGRDQRLDRIVAIKVVPISNRRADAMRRFRMEAQSAAKLDHPNIARVYYVGETERWSYIVFEFIEGTNLRQLVLEHGLLTVDDATHFICQVAEALQHAHDRGVVHRDIKPSNILIGTDGKAKLVDMGLARTTELDRSTGDLTASGVTLGTFDYISPEQAHDPRDADVRSDIYSLGCTLYFLLTGQPPFPDGTALQKLLMHGTKMPEDPRFFRNDLSDSLIEILRKMMAKKPKDRYQTPNDLVNDLRTLAVIDSLSWSQDFNDEVLASSQSKRPWWESAMPSLVSLLLIALSTMWLYNANQLSAIFSIPQVEFVDPSPDSNLEIASVASSSNLASDNTDSADAKLRSNAEPRNRPGNEGNESSGRSASDPSDESNPAGESTLDKTVVIGKPGTIYGIDMDDSYLSATSLDEALSLVITDDSIGRVVVAEPVLSIGKPIDLAGLRRGRELRIEAAPGGRARIVFDESSIKSSNENENEWFGLHGGRVSFHRMDFVWNASMLDSRPQSMFGSGSGSQLDWNECTITVQHQGSMPLPSIVRNTGSKSAVDLSANATVGSVTTSRDSVTARDTLASASSLSMNRCAIRGQCDWCHTDSTERMDVAIDQSWISISGSMLLADGVKTLNRSPKLRMELDHVSCITLSPFVRIRMSTMNAYPIAFVRVAKESVFAGASTLVEWDASNCTDWGFAAQAKRIEDLGRWIDLRGLDNSYDVPSISRLVQVIMSMSSEEVSIDSDSNLLMNERGMELLSTWQSGSRVDGSKMHLQSPKLRPGSYVGVQPGSDPDKLPPLPNAL